MNRNQQIYICVDRAFRNCLITNFAVHEWEGGTTIIFKVLGEIFKYSDRLKYSANIYFPALKEYSNGKIECNYVKPKRAVCYALGRLYKLLKRKGLLNDR